MSRMCVNLPGECGHSAEAWMLGKCLQVVDFVTGMLNTGRGMENSASARDVRKVKNVLPYKDIH